MKKLNVLKKLFIIFFVALQAPGILAMEPKQKKKDFKIVDYCSDRDYQKIKNFFENNIQNLGKFYGFDEDDSVKVITKGDDICAFVSYGPKPRSAQGEIYFLGVFSDYRRKGLARTLVQYSVDDMFADGFKKVCLSTGNANKGARALYESEGFSLDISKPNQGCCRYKKCKKNVQEA